jgi:hypothetical protein
MIIVPVLLSKKIMSNLDRWKDQNHYDPSLEIR